MGRRMKLGPKPNRDQPDIHAVSRQRTLTAVPATPSKSSNVARIPNMEAAMRRASSPERYLSAGGRLTSENAN
jgi:hypothetical protein